MVKIFRILMLLTVFIISTTVVSLAQKDITFYKPTKDFFGKPDTILTMDFTKIRHPRSVDSFKPLPHLPPVRQDTTGTCWAFAMTSFLESEIMRMGGPKVKLSEMYTVYYEYIEKAREYVRTRGNSLFGQGSEENAVILRIKKYGIVRKSDYSGLLPNQTKYTHEKMFARMNNYLKFVKENNYWDENIVLAHIRMILNKYMGEPPRTIVVAGKEITPLQYATEVLKLPLDEYVDFMSFKYLPFYTKGEYKVPDNWWHSKEYHNVPLDDWYNAIVNAVKKGYTVAIGGDVTEVGKCGEEDIAIIPPFDMDFRRINQDAREFRFYNETSTDDHAIHIVGYQHFKGHDWFLVKDSGYSATKGKFRGYYFFRDDFVKLKMLTFLVHKDAVADLLKKFK